MPFEQARTVCSMANLEMDDRCPAAMAYPYAARACTAAVSRSMSSEGSDPLDAWPALLDPGAEPTAPACASAGASPGCAGGAKPGESGARQPCQGRIDRVNLCSIDQNKAGWLKEWMPSRPLIPHAARRRTGCACPSLGARPAQVNA